MSDNYEAIITIPVSIVAEMIEGDMTVQDYEDIEEYVLGAAAIILQDLILQFKEVARG